MRFLLCLMAVAICHAGRIPRGLQYEQFPNLRTVYHGHGATSYQNVEVQNHGEIPVATKPHVGHINYVHQDPSLFSDYGHLLGVPPVTAIPFVEENSIDNHFLVSSIGPFGGGDAGHVEFNSNIAHSYYDHYDHDHGYEYH